MLVNLAQGVGMMGNEGWVTGYWIRLGNVLSDEARWIGYGVLDCIISECVPWLR